jgi:hypothetical protein
MHIFLSDDDDAERIIVDLSLFELTEANGGLQVGRIGDSFIILAFALIFITSLMSFSHSGDIPVRLFLPSVHWALFNSLLTYFLLSWVDLTFSLLCSLDLTILAFRNEMKLVKVIEVVLDMSKNTFSSISLIVAFPSAINFV